jgi:hypothetical protein
LAATQALKQRRDDNPVFEIGAGRGEVRVSQCAGPQIVVFAIDSAGWVGGSMSNELLLLDALLQPGAEDV